MKKILLILMAIFAFGLQNVCAQDAPLKIVTNHPDFSIKVKRCAASGKTVIIDLILNNNGTNDVENVTAGGGEYGRAVAYDDEGNIYEVNAIKVKVANKPEYTKWETDKFNIPSGVPMKLSVQLEGVPQSAESIARLKLVLKCSVWGLNDDKPVKINNIPITRD